MSNTARPKSVGDELSADEVNKDLPIVLNAGETISGATLPVAVFVLAADGEVYACDGNDTAKLNFIGFAVSDSTNGNPIQVQTHGVVSGFTGLTKNAVYYVADDKTLSTTRGTYIIPVGIAVSATQIAIFNYEPPKYTNGSTTYDLATASGTQNIAHGLGRVPKFIRITGLSSSVMISTGVYNGTTSAYVNRTQGGNSGGSTGLIININLNGTDYQQASVTVTSTNIVLAWTKNGSPTGTAYLLWEAYS